MSRDLPLLQPNLNVYSERYNELLNGRYRVLRHLGDGAHSSVLLVQDTKFNTDIVGESETAIMHGSKYLAAKILTVDMTQNHAAGISRERHFMERIQAQREKSSGLPVLYDCFDISGQYGTHLCLVMEVYGSSLVDFRKPAPGKVLSVHLVRRIIAQLVGAVAQLHDMGVIHTDIKPANILVNSVKCDLDIEEYLEKNPPIYDGYFQLPGRDNEDLPDLESLTLQTSNERNIVKHRHMVTQPLPFPLSWNCSPKETELIHLTLIDFGKAQATGEQPTVENFAPTGLRSPEEILRCYFGPKIDIWAIGCLAFEFLTGRWLFHPEEGEIWSEDDDHLAKMLELTGEDFNDTMLNFSLRKEDFFDDDYKLKNIPDLIPLSIEQALSVYKCVPESEVGPAAEFIRACLRLDPLQRPSAKELEKHSWLSGTFSC